MTKENAYNLAMGFYGMNGWLHILGKVYSDDDMEMLEVAAQDINDVLANEKRLYRPASPTLADFFGDGAEAFRDWAMWRRSEYLKTRIKELESQKRWKEVRKLRWDLRFLVDKPQGWISKEMIARANQSSIAEIMGIERSNRVVVTNCPFQEGGDKNKSFAIYPDHFYCFACNASGDAIEFLRKRDKISFREAVLKLCAQ